jgi:phospholipid/cholesterol/gamma-HCH transport system permease protein
MLAYLENLGHFLYFALRTLVSLPSSLRQPRELGRQLHGIFFGALPLGVVAGLALGGVVWLHLHSVLQRFGATQFLPQALALAVVLEFAPTGAGLIVAGRSGASLGAELGSMRLTEQIDALEAMGQAPIRLLVAPRVLACMVALPLLTIFIIYCGLAGSFAAELAGGNLSWVQYRTECLRGLRLTDVIPATVKTVVFGYLIGMSGCFFGMEAKGGTEGVGRAATRGVVVATLLVLASNVVLVRLIQLLS